MRATLIVYIYLILGRLLKIMQVYNSHYRNKRQALGDKAPDDAEPKWWETPGRVIKRASSGRRRKFRRLTEPERITLGEDEYWQFSVAEINEDGTESRPQIRYELVSKA